MFKALKHLESLTSLPNAFGIVLKNLHTLNLHRCEGLGCSPEGLVGLPKLKKLVLSYCSRLECLPGTFFQQARCISSLEGTPNELWPSSRVSFPDLQPGAMPRLEHLHLHGWEQLVDFPKSIANLIMLLYLDLSACRSLRSLEHDGVGVQSLANLEELNLSESEKILTLPGGLEALPKLRRIFMSETKITFSQEAPHLVRR